MPLHDWGRVPRDVFPTFHNSWMTRLYDALNGGGMPPGYYVTQDTQAGEYVSDLLGVRGAGVQDDDPAGGLAVAVAPPKVAQRREYGGTARGAARRRRLSVRRGDGGRLVAVVEIVSPANKDRAASVRQFVGKIVSAVETGVHVLVVDLFPPTPRDPAGLPAEIGAEWGDDYEPDPAKPLAFASYVADDPPVAYLEPLAVGDPVPDMPLFLDPGRYVSVPLGETYAATYRAFPPKYRRILDG